MREMLGVRGGGGVEGGGGGGAARVIRDRCMCMCMCEGGSACSVRICGCKSATFGGGPHLEKNLLQLMRSRAITMFVF
jgi:hypothetical protein